MPAIGGLDSGRRPTRLIVDTGVIERNAAIITQRLSPGSRLMAVVKANAYGHGSVETAFAAIRGGASSLGTATVDEAVQLRDAGVEVPILVLSSSDPSEAKTAARNHIAIGVGDPEQIIRLLAAMTDEPRTAPLAVHLKIDTGMRRFGVRPDESVATAQTLNQHPHVKLTGVYSHFADSDHASTNRLDQQLNEFSATLADLSAAGIRPECAHISNSAALLRVRNADLSLVRAGICLYGIAPSENVSLFEGMKPALEWRATVQHILETSPNDRVGYGGTYVATERERIAILPIGYADGYPRHLSNVGWVGFQGQRLPVRGRVSMDQCAVGIPHGLQVRVGDELTILGAAETGAPSANELAASIGTIGYEIVARLSRRIPVDYRS